MKLTPEKVKHIRRLYADGFSMPQIAKRYALHVSTIFAVIRRKTWKWLD